MDINDILGGLSQEDMDSLRQAASSLMSGGGLSGLFGSDGNSVSSADAGNTGQGTGNGTQRNTAQSPGQDTGFDVEAFGKIAALMSSLGKRNDPRCQLIMSLKPMLSPGKQKKADEAVRILHLIDMIPALRDSGLLKGVL